MENFDDHKLLRFGLKEDTINAFDIIILPENYFIADNEGKLFDATESIILFKILKQAEIKVANSLDLGLDVMTYERRSDEKWYGVVYLRNNLLLPILAGVISNLATTSLQTDTTPNKIHIELRTETPRGLKTLKYDGDEATFLKLLKAMEEEPKQ